MQYYAMEMRMTEDDEEVMKQKSKEGSRVPNVATNSSRSSNQSWNCLKVS